MFYLFNGSDTHEDAVMAVVAVVAVHQLVSHAVLQPVTTAEAVSVVDAVIIHIACMLYNVLRIDCLMWTTLENCYTGQRFQATAR